VRVGIFRIKVAARAREWVGGGAWAVPDLAPAGDGQGIAPHPAEYMSASGAVC